MAAQLDTAIRAMAIALDGKTLLLPSSMVAEVVLFSPLEPRLVNAPAWLMGFLPWRGMRLPVMSYDAFLNADYSTVASSGNRIVVIKTLDPTLGFDFYGLLSSRMPRLTSVEPEEIQAVAAESSHPRIAAEALLRDERVLIPDIEALEKGLWAVLPT